MSKIKLLLITIMLVLSLCACGQKSAIQQATGADAKQNRAIDDTLESAGISYEMINEAIHNRPQTEIPEDFKVYNLVDSNGENYFMVLNGDFEVVALLDNDEGLIYGALK